LSQTYKDLIGISVNALLSPYFDSKPRRLKDLAL